MTWPYWPLKLRTSSSHDEGCTREFAISTKEFIGEKGKVTGLKTVRVEWKDGKMIEIAGSEQVLKADLVLLAMGFVNPVASVLDAFGIDKDARGNAKASTEFTGAYATNVAKVFAAGDIRRGQSLVVWAIREGRQAARAVDEFLMGSSELPRCEAPSNFLSQAIIRVIPYDSRAGLYPAFFYGFHFSRISRRTQKPHLRIWRAGDSGRRFSDGTARQGHGLDGRVRRR